MFGKRADEREPEVRGKRARLGVRFAKLRRSPQYLTLPRNVDAFAVAVRLPKEGHSEREASLV